jgi:phosphate uptake regulator
MEDYKKDIEEINLKMMEAEVFNIKYLINYLINSLIIMNLLF